LTHLSTPQLSLKSSNFRFLFSKNFTTTSFWSNHISMNKIALIFFESICSINFSYNSNQVFFHQYRATAGS
jgi:hypothetical protein